MTNKNLQRLKKRKEHKYGERRATRRQPAIVLDYGGREYVKLEGDTRKMVKDMVAKLGITNKEIREMFPLKQKQ